MIITPKCISELRVNYSSFSPKVRQVADYIIAHPEDVINNSIQALSKKIGVSQYSVLNCIRSIGYQGYSDFRLALAVGSQPVSSVSDSSQHLSNQKDANIYQDLLQTYEANARCLLDSLYLINSEAFVTIIKKIFSAKRISIYGLGTSAYCANYLCLQLVRLGMHALVITEAQYQIFDALTLIENDLLIAFSCSGKAPSTIEAFKYAKDRGCYTIAVTSFMNSALAQAADLPLFTTSSGPRYAKDADNAIIEQMSLASAISTAVYHELQRGMTRTI